MAFAQRFGCVGRFDHGRHAVHGLELGGIQAVGMRMALEQCRGVNRHRAVEKNRQGMRYLALCLQLRNGMQQGLSAANGKYRDHRHSATSANPLQGTGELTQDIFFRVGSVSIGGLDQYGVRRGRCIGRVHQEIVGAS